MAVAIAIRFVVVALLAGAASFSAAQTETLRASFSDMAALSPSCCFFVIF